MKIVYFPIGAKNLESFEGTVYHPVSEKLIRSFLPNHEFQKLKEQSKGEGYYCWGIKPGPKNKKNWDTINVGDRVIVAWEKEYKLHSTIIFKTQNKLLADKLWGAVDSDNNTLDFICFFEKPIKLVRPIPIEDAKDYLLKGSNLGFFIIKEDRVNKIIVEFGSLEGYLKQVKSGSQG